MELCWNRRGFALDLEYHPSLTPSFHLYTYMPVHALDSEDHSSLLVRKVVPLAGNPELEVISTQLGKGWTREYRVDNVRTLDSGRRISGNNASGWIDFLLAAAAVWLI